MGKEMDLHLYGLGNSLFTQEMKELDHLGYNILRDFAF